MVHFAEYYRYMEAAEHALFRAAGLSVQEHEGRPALWPRVQCSFEYLHPLRFEEEFQVQLEIERLGARSVTFRAEVQRGDELLALGRSTSVFARPQAAGDLQSAEIPASIRNALGPFLRRDEGAPARPPEREG